MTQKKLIANRAPVTGIFANGKKCNLYGVAFHARSINSARNIASSDDFRHGSGYFGTGIYVTFKSIPHQYGDIVFLLKAGKKELTLIEADDDDIAIILDQITTTEHLHGVYINPQSDYYNETLQLFGSDKVLTQVTVTENNESFINFSDIPPLFNIFQYGQ
jgi:hypothetical protein